MFLSLIYRRYILLITACFTLAGWHFSYAQAPVNDSVKVAVKPEYDQVSGFHRSLFGENYRKLWAMPVNLKVFHLTREHGGLKITDIGGGMQTKSLHLEDAEGHKWALRTVSKYPGRALPKRLKHTIVEYILTDEVTTSHPYAALTVPPMAEALAIPHSNPQYVYVPDDPAFGKYRKDFAGQVCVFEEREPLDGTKTDKTEKVQDKVEGDNDHLIDQKLVLRARLLDMVMGDWDRHEDQWRWEKEKDDDKQTLYQPMPTDRDKVFYTTSGIFPWFLSHQFLKSQLQPYRSEIRDIPGYNFNARTFDHYFLTELDEKDWREQIAYVQSKLTDEVISQAMKRLPANVYQASAPQIIATLKGRRDNLPKYALEYYRFLSKDVNIPASDKNEQVLVENQRDGDVKVTIRKIKKDDSTGHKVYQRTFKPQITREIRLYALNGENDFVVKGSGESRIKVRLIGGKDKDSYTIDSGYPKQNLYIYDHPDTNNVLPSNRQAHIHLTKDTLENKFNRKSFVYDNAGPLFSIGYNTDEGVRLIGGYQYIKQGFGRAPYAWRQEFLAGYTLSRHSWLFNYTGDFKKAVGTYDLNVSVVSRGPNNQANFFGMGNQPEFVNSGYQDIDYYRNRYNWLTADVRLYHTYGSLQVSAGVIGQYYYSDAADNTNKFLGQYNLQHPQENVFSNKSYSGLVAGTSLDTRDDIRYPTKGILWNTTLTGITGLNVHNNNFSQLHSEFSFYLNPGKDSVLVIANRMAAGYMVGKASFFQYLSLGGPQNLRGFHTNRFIGNAIAYDNLELRWKVVDLHAYLFPVSLGVVAFNDIGRVWLRGESSDQWHDGYGGGIFILPGKMVILAEAGFSKEGVLPYLSIGYRF